MLVLVCPLVASLRVAVCCGWHKHSIAFVITLPPALCRRRVHRTVLKPLLMHTMPGMQYTMHRAHVHSSSVITCGHRNCGKKEPFESVGGLHSQLIQV